MKMMISTIKWDAISHIMFLRWFFLGFLVAVVLYMMMPAEEYAPQLLSVGVSLIGVALLIAPMYLVYMHPVISPAYDLYYHGMGERMPNRPFAMIMASKLFCNIVIVAVGVVITYFLNLYLGIGTVVTLDHPDVVTRLLSDGFVFSLFVPMFIVFVYLLMAVDSKSLGKLKTFAIYMLAVVQVANIFLLRRINVPNITNVYFVSRMVEVVLFVAMFIISCWLYDRKVGVDCKL